MTLRRARKSPPPSSPPSTSRRKPARGNAAKHARTIQRFHPDLPMAGFRLYEDQEVRPFSKVGIEGLRKVLSDRAWAAFVAYRLGGRYTRAILLGGPTVDPSTGEIDGVVSDHQIEGARKSIARHEAAIAARKARLAARSAQRPVRRGRP